jgi:hypothetical protein
MEKVFQVLIGNCKFVMLKKYKIELVLLTIDVLFKNKHNVT